MYVLLAATHTKLPYLCFNTPESMHTRNHHVVERLKNHLFMYTFTAESSEITYVIKIHLKT